MYKTFNISSLWPIFFYGFFSTLTLGLTFGAANSAAQRTTGGVSAEPKLSSYAIDKQSLSTVLQIFGEQSGLQILYPSAILEGKESDGLNGRYTATEALEQLTRGQGVEFLFVSENAVILRRVDEPLDPVPAQKKALVAEDRSTGTLETVEVTGSRLPRPEFEFLYPTLTIDSNYLFQISATDIGKTLESLPAVCNGGFSTQGSPVERNIGSSFPDLYCLGSQRTLTLVNGHRMVSSNEVSVIGSEKGSQFDINAIPNSMIERVEVVSVGGAPVYGADAIAGTINIILRENFEGFELDLSGGISDRKDGEQVNFSMLAGKNFLQEKANITFGYEYHKQRAIHATAREYTANDFTYLLSEEGEVELYRDVTDVSESANGFPLVRLVDTNEYFFLDNGEGEFFTLGREGGFTPLDLGSRIGGEFFQGGIGRRESERWSLRLPLERHMISMLTHLELSDTLKLFGEFEYYKANSATRSFNTLSAELPVDTNNPFLRPDTRAFILQNFDSFRELGYEGDIEFGVTKELVDLTGFVTGTKNEIGRAIIGLEGQFSTSAGEWNWSASYNRGHSYLETIDFDIYRDDFYAAAGIEFGEGGPIACAPGSAGNSNPCFEAIRFSPLGLLSDPELRGQLSERPRYLARQDQQVANVNLRAELDFLPAGVMSFAFGLQRRLENAYAKPDEFNRNQSGFFDRVERVEGSFDTTEVYGEVLIPLLDDSALPLVESLTFESSFRQLEHSTAGSDVAWTAGGRLSLDGPGDSTIIVRGNATESVRAPSITESSAPITQVGTTGFLLDPCDIDAVAAADDPQLRRALCQAEVDELGLPPGFSLDNYESLVRLDGVSVVGNPNLSNERSRSSTVGFVMQSGGRDSAQFALDFINITIEDLIQQDYDTLLMSCYEPNPQSFCEFYQRDPRTFQISQPLFPYQNLGTLRFRAVQMAALIPLPVERLLDEATSMSIDIQAYLLRERRLDDEENQAGTFLDPKKNVRVALNYGRGNIDLSWTAFYQDAVSYVIFGDDLKVDGFWQHFLAARYQLSGSLSVRGGVRNVFDWQPDEILESVDAAGPYAPIGREYSLGVNFVF